METADPLAAVVIVHHASFGYLQYNRIRKIYFTQLDTYLQTFVIHGILATVVFFIAAYGLSAEKTQRRQIVQNLKWGVSEEEQLQRSALLRSMTN